MSQRIASRVKVLALLLAGGLLTVTRANSTLTESEGIPKASEQ